MQVGPLARVLNMLAAGHQPTKKYATPRLILVSALAKTKVGLDAMHSTIGRHAARAVLRGAGRRMLALQWDLLLANIGKGDPRPSTSRSSPRAR
jgi:hydrogenase large subunit